MKFTKATKKQSRARIALMGPAGSGKTWNALELATALGARVAVIDSERGSASKYSDRFSFDVLELDSHGPNQYVDAIQAAEREGYDVAVIDSWSHAWMGKDGILERVDNKGGFSGGGWRDATPQHNRMVDAILQARLHVIVTLRVKTEYVVEKNDKGKQVPRKVGLAPVQRDGVEYEFDVVGMIDDRNSIEITKTRCAALHDRSFRRETPALAETIKAWLTDGAPMPEPAPKAPPAAGATTSTTAPAPAGEGPKDGGGQHGASPPSSRSANGAGRSGKTSARPTSTSSPASDDPLEDLKRTWCGSAEPDAQGVVSGLGRTLDDYVAWMSETFPVTHRKFMTPQHIKDAYALTAAMLRGPVAYTNELAGMWAAGRKYGPSMNDLPEEMGGQPPPKAVS